MYKIIFSIIFILFCSHAFASADDEYVFAKPTDASRFSILTTQIRCVVCQGQSLADSNAPIAMDLKMKIHTLIEAHKSDEEIKTYLVKRYGEFILMSPRLSTKTGLLWLFPYIGLFMLLTFWWFYVRKKQNV